MRLAVVITGFLAACLTAASAAPEESPSPLLEALDLQVNGFVDTRAGLRTQNDPAEHDDSLGELRLQLDVQRYFDKFTAEVRADFLYDWTGHNSHVDLERGEGWFDLREAHLLFSPQPWMDVKAGRQILTWGTGDLLFINDLFPKDWASFFIGRDEAYLKAPSDAVLVSLFPTWANIDLVYTPRFDPDRFITGERISFWNPATGNISGRDDVLQTDVPNDLFSDHEVAGRLSRNVNGYELAAYGYYGFWKSPAGMDPDTGDATFPALSVYGASARGQAAGGIANIEAGYYDSRDDHSGDDPTVRNSEARILVGYQRELARNLNATVQYYLEHMMDHDDYEHALPEGQHAADEDRHVFTLRLTQLLLGQNLVLSFFTFYSPSDQDAYIRPVATYKVSDDWMVTAGGNFFMGENDDTFFGQFDQNNNLYAGARYSF